MARQKQMIKGTTLLSMVVLLLALTSTVLGSKTKDEEFKSDFYDCERFAKQFPNTCKPLRNVEATYNFDDVPLEDKICYNIEEGKCAGVNMNNACVLKRQLCVMCFQELVGSEYKVRMRVQTNTIPYHCYQLELHRYIEVRKVDFTVDWLPKADDQVNVTSQRQVNKLLCDANAAADSNIPEGSNFKNNGDVLNDVWGVSTSGALFSTAVSEDKVDPFYPAAFGRNIKSSHLLKQNVDWCLSSTNANRMYQYKMPSVCLVDAQKYEVKELPLTENATELVKEVWQDIPYRTTIGIAKDGRPILSPMKNGGELYDHCDVDVCNGLMVGDHYMYASTTFHPYIMGCFGKGNSPDKYQECSTNPRLCGIEYKGVITEQPGTKKKKSQFATGAVVVITLQGFSSLALALLMFTSSTFF